MLIRVSGYNDGGKEYLEEGQKNGRELSREELDNRVILYGDLDLTQMIYQQIPDKGQERYATFTLSFREDDVPHETMLEVTKEFRQFLMYAYDDEEYNFYAEAHLPKIKKTVDKKTGETVERKPHIHIFIPRKNLLTGKEMNPRGMHDSNVKYFEAFQEYINQKYKLSSPREHVRVDPTSVADVLSRYKGDDFRSKNQDFKKQLVADVIGKNITSRADFYQHVSSFGDTKVRNKGRENEYIAVKLPGDAKFTNLKETIFQDDFIVRREVKKPPLDKAIIRDRLCEWPQRAKEIKYVSKATPKFRQLYKDAEPADKINLLAQRQAAFYEKHRGKYELHPAERQRDHQRSAAEIETGGTARATDGVQGVPRGHVATDGYSREAERAVLLPGDAHFHLGQQESGGGTGLRSDLPAGGRRGRNPGEHDFDKFTAIPGIPTVAESARRRGYSVRDGMGGGDAGGLDIPVYARNLHRVASMETIEKRGSRLFGRRDTPVKSTAVNLIRRVMPKPDKNASFVAAYFLRQHEQNQILPEHRRELRAVDKLFFDVRRSIFGDDRLTRNEKTQYVSVLTFERLKAHHAIKQPDIPFKQESPEMGSEDIRQLIKNVRLPDNSISGAPEEEQDIPLARERFSRLIQNVNAHMSDKRHRDRQRAISPNDVYTKKAKLSKNVHYLDKKTDRTLFVDTGNAIAVRKGGMTDSAVAVALELAKEKFGSTLTIKGSQKFKDQVVEVVAKNNLDVHFTDKAMNKKFEERKAEIAIEKGGQRIEQPDTGKIPTQEKTADESTVDEKSRDTGSTAENIQNATQPETAEAEKQNIHEGVLLAHGAAAYKFKPDLNKPEDKRDDSYFVKLHMADGKTKTLWGVGLENAVNGLQNGERVKFEDRGVEHVKWQEEQQDGSFMDKSGQRRIWEGSPLDRERENDKETTTQERQSPERMQDNDEPEYDL